MKKKLLAALLASAMVLSVTACGDTGSEAGGSETGSSSSQTQASGGEESKESSDAAPAEREEKTVSAFVMQSVTGESGIWQGWGAKKLYDDLKLKIDFDPTGNEVETKLQQYLVAGQLPDLVAVEDGTTQLSQSF